MIETRTVISCVQCDVFWDPAAEPTGCSDSDHEHRTRSDSHLHRTRVELPDQTVVTAVSFGGPDPYARKVRPDFGLYLEERWEPPWPYEHFDWPDFGIPDDRESIGIALASLLDRARLGESVEIGCYGGHGRTGTALACLAVLCGKSAGEAVEWVRTIYCERAVETEEQAAFVRDFKR